MLCSFFTILSLVAFTQASEQINVNLVPGHKPLMLMNPNYPRRTDPQLDMKWIIETESPAKISIHCPDFRMAEANPCKDSYLVINEGQPDEETVCGTNPEYKKLSISSSMTVRYLGGPRGGGPIKCIVQATTTDNIYHYLGADPSEADSGEAGLISVPGKRQTSCKCGWVNKRRSRIFGGRDTSPNEYPWLVALVAGSERKAPICGGSIITQYHVLTAAHCVADNKGQLYNQEFLVLIGEHDWQVENNDARQMIKVKDVIMHEKYKGYSKGFDITVLNLESEIKFSDKVGPICLSPINRDIDNEWVKVMGWGQVNNEGYYSTIPKVANVRTVNIEVCSAKLYNLLRTEDPFQVCTWAKGDDSCHGDSGGPLVWANPETNRYTQIALGSYTLGCGGPLPAVHTKVPYYLDWIRTQVANSNPQGTICS